MRIYLFVLTFIFSPVTICQVTQFPYIENFDSVAVPALPPGWSTTTNRTSSGDFATTKSSPYSDSNAVISTNATISQCLISPILDFSNKHADSLRFYERRSSSHTSGVIIDMSTDGGETFSMTISETLNNPGTSAYIKRNFPLPSALSNQPSVQIRWHVLGNGTGTSGTIRIDDITIIGSSNIDIAITAVNFSPEYPADGDSVRTITTIKNTGRTPVLGIPMEFFIDANANSLPDLEEQFDSVNIQETLQPGDTIRITSRPIRLNRGSFPVIAQLSFPSDQNPGNDIKLLRLAVGYLRRTLIINEIMYAPVSPEPEWIELFNPSPDTINIQHWKISNRLTNTKYLITTTTTLLKPSDYIILTKDMTSFTAIHPDLPSLILQTAIPTYFLNNTGDAVVLFDERGAIMDSVRYFTNWGGTDSTSLERIESHVGSNDSLNWGPSGDSSGSTPGQQNYLTPLECDLRIFHILPLKVSPTLTEIGVTLYNAGYQEIDAVTLSLFHDMNGDSIPQTSELIEDRSLIPALKFKDSSMVTFRWNTPAWGHCQLIAVADYTADMRISDNTLHHIVKITYPEQSLVINEIMYEPKSGDAEYIELSNPGTDSIDLHDWKLADITDTSSTTTKYTLSSIPFIIGPKEYAVIAFDSTICNRFSYFTDSSYRVIIKSGSVSLNNDGDTVLLTDLTGEIIDSLRYLPSWHNADISDAGGRSLERINPFLPSTDPRNWSTCANALGGTPGKQNSLFTISIPTNATISCFPNPFSPDGDGYEDVTLISYKLSTGTATIRIRIYDALGRIIRSLAHNDLSGANGSVIWDGYNDNRERARVGIYIILLESLDGTGENNQTVKGTVVVGQKL